MAPYAKQLFSGSALRVLHLLAGALVGLALLPFMVHTLGDRMYGLWALVGTLMGYYGLLDFGLSTAVTRHLAGAVGARDEKEFNRVFNTALLLYAGVGVAALAVTAVVAGIADRLASDPADGAVFSMLILILGMNAAIDFPARALAGTLEAQLHYNITAGVNLLTLALRATGTVAVLLAGYGVVGLAVATMLAAVPGIVLKIYFTRRKAAFLRLGRAYWEPATARRLFSYSSFTFIAQLGDMLRFRVDTVVIAAYVSLATVTVYAIPVLLTKYFIALLISALGVLQPVFSQKSGAGDQEGMRRVLFFGTKLSMCLSSFVAFGFIAWGRPFIERWMGAQYLEAYPVLVVLTLGCLFALWQSPSVQLLYGTSRHRFYALQNTAEGVANLVLSLILVRHYGIMGVALGTFIPIAVTKLLTQPVYVCRVAGIPLAEYYQRLAATLLRVTAALVLPALLALRFASPDYLTLAGLGVVSAVLYVVPLWLFEFSRAETATLRSAMLPRTLQTRDALTVTKGAR